MRVLVTGGAGYVGSHTVLALLNSGHDVHVVDNLSNSHWESVRRIEELTARSCGTSEVDVRDLSALESIFTEFEPDAVMHFASFKSVPESVSNPIYYYDNNVYGLLQVCRAASQANVRHLLFSSSATVYDPTNKMPVAEDGALGPVSTYGWTKRFCEQVLQDFHTAQPETTISLLRYFNPAGAHPSGKIGEDPEGIPGNLLPFIAQVAVGRREKLMVYGNDYPTHDGTGIRDYIHVEDIAEGHLLAIEKDIDEPVVRILNLGTGTGASVFDVRQHFEKASGVEIPYEVVDRRPGDVAVAVADPALAAKELGWSATRGLEQICLDLWNWQRLNPHGYIES